MAGAEGWIAELWAGIVGMGPGVRERGWHRLPALGRVTVTRPELLTPFEEHNRRHPEQAVRPPNFISVAYPKVLSRAEDVRLFAPYVSDPALALNSPWFEMRSGEEVSITTDDLGGLIVPGLIAVKSYGDVAREYAAHPEAKFAAPGGGPCLRTTTGALTRRHVTAGRAEYIGKEGNLLDRRAEGVGLATEVQAVYEDPDDFRRYFLPALRQLPPTSIAEAARLSPRAVRDILSERRTPRAATRQALGTLPARPSLVLLSSERYSCGVVASPPVPTDAVAPLLLEGIVELVKHGVNADRRAGERREYLRGIFDGDKEVRAAVELAAARLTEVPSLDDRQGGERLRSFLRSPEALQLVSQIYLMKTVSHEDSLETIQNQFIVSMSAWTGLPAADLEASGGRLFEAFVAACNEALQVAVQQNALAAHEATAVRRHQELRDQLANIDRNIALVKGMGTADLETILTFESEYRKQVASREAYIVPPNLDNNEKKPIDELYVTPSFEVKSEHPSGWARVDYDEMRSELHRAVLLGDPGGGKSTFALKLCHDLALATDYEVPQTPTPVLVTLREYGAAKERESCSILDFIESQARSRYQMATVPHGAFEYLFRNGRALVVFDGLDELLDTSHRREISGDVESFSALYSATPILVTSRRVGYEQAPLNHERFSTYHLSDFDEPQITDYATKWFQFETDLSPDERAARVAAFVSESSVVPDLRSNPLMLGLICNIYRGENYIPANRPEVFEKCAVMLFERWDKGRGIEVQLPFESRLRPAMQYLAHRIYSDGELQAGVSRDRLVQETSQYLHPRRFEDVNEAREAAQRFIDLCKGRAWVFTDTGSTGRGEPLFQFTHRTFLEYFTADYLARTNSSPTQLIGVLRPRIEQREWDVVAQLAVQIQSRYVEDAADGLLTHLLDASAEAHGEEARGNLISFCARSLEFLVPSPRVIRAITAAAVEAVYDADVAVASQTDGQVEMQQPGPDAEPILGALMSAGRETRGTVQKALTSALDKDLSSGSTPRQILGLEIGLHIRLAHRSVYTEEFGNATGWKEFSDSIASHWGSLIRTLAPAEFGVAFDGVLQGVVSLRDFVDVWGTDGLFRSRAYRVYNNVQSVPLASIAVLFAQQASTEHADPGATSWIDGSPLAPLTDLARVLSEEPPPWASNATVEGHAFLHYLLDSESDGFESWDSGHRFGAFCVGAVHLEASSHDGTGGLPSELLDNSRPVSLFLSSLLSARNDDSGREPSAALATLSSDQAALVRAWISRRIDFVTV